MKTAMGATTGGRKSPRERFRHRAEQSGGPGTTSDTTIDLTVSDGEPRVLGQYTGRFALASDFDAPLPSEVQETPAS